jgi:CubicO group peptidase (beta-lactamase class C family)
MQPDDIHRRDLLRWTAATGALLLSGGCGGGGGAEAAPAAVGTEEPIARSWDELTPENQAATFRNADRVGPTRAFSKGSTVLALPAHARSLLALNYDFGGQRRTPQDYMARHRTAGLLVLKGGQIALELYGMGNQPTSRWTSFSVAKSLTSTLVGAALQSAALSSLDRRVEALLPDFAGTAYDGTTLRQLLRMSSGVRWVEAYADPNSDVGLFSAAVRSSQPGAVRALMRSRLRAAAPGSAFNYSTGETYVLGAALAAATGQSLSAFLTETLWSRAGMQADGYWLLDAPGGLELAGGNFSATLRDYGRLGLFVLREGVVGANRWLPLGWRDLAGRPDSALTSPGSLYPGYALGYGYHWWSLPASAAFTAQGVFGQFLYIDPLDDLVAVVWSAWPTPLDSVAEQETYALLAAATLALR